MIIEKQQIQAIIEDLNAKKDRLEERKQPLNDVRPEHMGAAIYSHVISQLKGLLPNG
ncbi:hypothetical protein OCO53_25420 [Peribacillus frigoritolerans]|uniref:hypothetical protein n=1 Tax=Peribacillus frigoritolerans TaxID=450367 RepID=UPI0021D313A0|nr:hypothetical protein [Peribacillus frigoritolerans]MCU6603783.1 hypothetical protein [Peribacillus frigoritolerans]